MQRAALIDVENARCQRCRRDFLPVSEKAPGLLLFNRPDAVGTFTQDLCDTPDAPHPKRSIIRCVIKVMQCNVNSTHPKPAPKWPPRNSFDQKLAQLIKLG
jgi:hypothetical protein